MVTRPSTRARASRNTSARSQRERTRGRVIRPTSGCLLLATADLVSDDDVWSTLICMEGFALPPEKSFLQTLADDRDRFLRFLESRVEDTATAEDILQTAYMKAVQH